MAYSHTQPHSSVYLEISYFTSIHQPKKVSWWKHCRIGIGLSSEGFMGESEAATRLIREQLREFVGGELAVGDSRIQQLLQLYGEEEEGLRCVLHTLLEEVFNEEEDDGFVIFDKEEIASVST